LYDFHTLQLILGKLLPQEKLDALMADHFATFITDYDLDALKSAHIDTLRIPVTYNTFIPEANRTDNFPRGELKALDVYIFLHRYSDDSFIERVLDYGMTIWLDLIATSTNQLGTLEQHGNTVTPETARQVVKYIAKKYDARVISFPSPNLIVGCNNRLSSSRRQIPKYTIKSHSTRSEIYRENQK
jgi:aryl-phospho-beta-D-glucosidase BglC (GH1 family)